MSRNQAKPFGRTVFLLAAGLLASAAAGQQSPALPCAADDKPCLLAAKNNSPVLKLGYWESALKKPVEQRIGAGSKELVEYLTLDNLNGDVPNRPHAARLTPDFLLDVQNAFGELPPEIKTLLSGKLAGIYLVDDIGGTGYTEQIFDAASHAVAGFIVLDPTVLEQRSANAWATWKENTPFKAQPGYRLQAEIEDARRDDRMHTIQYILLHELGHVLAIGGRFHPPWSVDPQDVGSTIGYPYFELSWFVPKGENRYASKFDAGFPQRKNVAYYFGAKLEADEMLPAYDNLERTNFATLYAATSPGDDFAEAFASYVHTAVMRRPFEIRIFRGGKLAKSYESCWAETRCESKRRILDHLLFPAK